MFLRMELTLLQSQYRELLKAIQPNLCNVATINRYPQCAGYYIVFVPWQQKLTTMNKWL